MSDKHSSCSSERTSIHLKEQNLIDNLGRSGLYTGAINQTTKRPHGNGKMIYFGEDDQIVMAYDGQWIQGDWSGFGKVTCERDCYSYEGTFLDNRRHGLGIMTYADGRIYDGSYQFDKRTGKGKMFYQDGSVYWGFWSSDGELPHGRGKLTLPDGTVYDGEFEMGCIQGHGRMTFPDGRWYLGEFSDGAQNGLGLEVRADGSLYHEGTFYNGIPAKASSFPQQKRSMGSKLLYCTGSYGGSCALVGPLPKHLTMKTVWMGKMHQ